MALVNQLFVSLLIESVGCSAHFSSFLLSTTLFVYVYFMVFNATFNNISLISWRSVLLVEETGIHRENH